MPVKKHFPKGASFLFFSFFVMFFAFSCKKQKSEADIVPPSTYPLSRSVIGWGVVIPNYIHILDEAGGGGRTAAILRRGAIVQIVERRPVRGDGEIESWVKARTDAYSGWLPESEIRVFDSKTQAETAVKSLEGH